MKMKLSTKLQLRFPCFPVKQREIGLLSRCLPGMCKNLTLGSYIIGVWVVRVHGNLVEVCEKQVGIVPA